MTQLKLNETHLKDGVSVGSKPGQVLFSQLDVSHTRLTTNDFLAADYVDIVLGGKTKVLKARHGNAGEIAPKVEPAPPNDTRDLIDHMLRGERAKRCDLWRPMVGMTFANPFVTTTRTLVEAKRDPYADEPSGPSMAEWEFPVFDAPTKGCLLQLLREGWGQPEVYCSPFPDGWGTWVWKSLVMGKAQPKTLVAILGPTEEDSMICALEEAWKDAMDRRSLS